MAEPLAPGGESQGCATLPKIVPSPKTNNYPAPKANSTEIEKPSTGHLYFSPFVLVTYTDLFLHLLSQQQ